MMEPSRARWSETANPTSDPAHTTSRWSISFSRIRSIARLWAALSLPLAWLPHLASAQVTAEGEVFGTNPFTSPTWDVGDILVVGGTESDGRLTINSGGVVSGVISEDEGFLTLMGLASGVSGVIDVNGGTFNTTAIAVGGPGSATLIVRNGGTVTLPFDKAALSPEFRQSFIIVAADPGATALLQVIDGTLNSGEMLDIGYINGKGTLEISGASVVTSWQARVRDGEAHVSGGNWNISDSLNLMNGGLLDISGDGSVKASILYGYGELRIRDSGALSGTNLAMGGLIDISGNGSVSASNQLTFSLNSSADISGNGSISAQTITIVGETTVRDSATVSAITLEIIGDGASFDLSGNASVEAQTIDADEKLVVRDSGMLSVGTLVVDGPTEVNGGSVNVSGSVAIGSNGRTGTLTINDGLVATEKSVFFGLGSGSHGLLQLNGGVLVTSGLMGSSSSPFLGGGTEAIRFNGGTLRLSKSVSELFPEFDPGTVTLEAGGGTIDTQGFNVSTASYGLSGPGGLIKKGTGRLTLGGANTYAGGTTVSEGTLTVTGSVQHPDSAFTVGGALAINGGTVTASTLTAAGPASDTATVTFNGGTLRLGGNQNDLFSGFAAGNVILGASGGTIDTQAFTVVSAVEFGGAGSLTKTGPGTLILTGANSHAGGITINGGVLELGGGGVLSTEIVNSATLRFNSSAASVIDGTISGDGDIELVGSGPVTFSGVNTYTGRLELDPGTTLRLENNAAASTRPIYVRNATIDYADGLNISNRVHLQSGGGDPDKVAVRLNVDSGTATQGEIFDGSLDSRVEKTGAGSLVLTTPNTIKGGVILSGGVLSFGASTSSLGSPVDGTLTFNGGTLRYTGEASATYGTPRPTSITAHGGTLDVTDAGSTFSLAGALSGTGTFTKTGAGTVNMAGTHSAYTGAIVVGQGRFQVSATTTTWAANAFSVAFGGELYLPSRSSGSYELGSLSGAGDVTLVANSGVVTKLTVGANNTDSTFAGAIATTGAGTGSLTKVGTGTLTLSGINTYTGATSVNAGKLVVNGSLASASVTVQSGAALGGSGSFGGFVAIGAGATLTPGNSPGTITFTEGLSLAGGSVLDFELGTLSDLIVVSGGLLLGPEAGVVTINLADSGGFKAGLYTLIDATGADMPLGVVAADFALGLTIAGYDYSLDLVGSQLLLTVVSHAIPEPATAAALAGLGALGAAALRRRRVG